MTKDPSLSVSVSASEAQSRAFWDRVARRYADTPIGNPEAYAQTLDLVLTRLKPQDHVLELGCGTGMTALQFAPHVARYVATDYAPEMIAIAREAAADAQVRSLETYVAGLGDANCPQGPFDVICAFNVLHLLPDRPEAFSALAARLRPGGLFISKTPCLSGPWRLLWPVLATLRYMGKAPGFSFLSVSRLERELDAAGLEICESGDYPKFPRRRFLVARKR